MEKRTQLQKQLKTRHVTMITIGGIIGAGIFMGSGAVIYSTGPAAVISYLLAGVLAMFVARMLGEMATANPHAGSFSEHVRLALGNWGGFAVGWLYWYFWVIAVAAEAVGAAGILHYWLPDIPVWIISLGLLVILTATNIFSVRSFGEIEFWFASIKVTAIILFLILGLAYVLGLWPDKMLSFENLTTHGGFTPHGIASIFQGIVPVMFAVIGTEIVTITAAESEKPKEAIAKAIKSVIWRILLFYVGSIFIITCVLPWNNAEIMSSPYVSVLKILGIPSADQIMNIVVLTALLSCLNSGLYISSRMLFGLANRGDAPRLFLSLNRNGVPVKAILFGTVFGYLAIIAAYFSPDLVFKFLITSSGAVVLFVYLLIAIAQLRMRARLEKEKSELQVRMWAYPYLTYLTILSIVAVLVLMATNSEMVSQLIMSLVSLVIVLIIYGIRHQKYSKSEVKPSNTNELLEKIEM